MKKDIPNNEIDFVIAWVDGNDLKWRKEKQKYLAEVYDKDTLEKQGEYRFRDWDLLHYWFRAVEKYAPWVRKIHFVTCGQIPQWLNTEHPKLHIVNHEDYIPKEYLPTFNSHVIELHMHRIPDLAEQFVYFNDDMYITREVTPEDFFVNGLPRDVFALDAIYCAGDSAGSYNCSDLEIINDSFNKNEQFKKHYKKWFCPRYSFRKIYRTLALMPWHWFPGFYYQHLPSNFLKSTFERVWEAAGDRLAETSKHRFRGKAQVNQWVFKYWQLADGKFVPQDIKSGKCFHVHEGGVKTICEAIQNKQYKLLCINDTNRTTEFEKKRESISQAFNTVLNKKSEFEL